MSNKIKKDFRKKTRSTIKSLQESVQELTSRCNGLTAQLVMMQVAIAELKQTTFAIKPIGFADPGTLPRNEEGNNMLAFVRDGKANFPTEAINEAQEADGGRG